MFYLLHMMFKISKSNLIPLGKSLKLIHNKDSQIITNRCTATTALHEPLLFFFVANNNRSVTNKHSRLNKGDRAINHIKVCHFCSC